MLAKSTQEVWEAFTKYNWRSLCFFSQPLVLAVPPKQTVDASSSYFCPWDVITTIII